MRSERERLDRIDRKIEQIQEELRAMRAEFEQMKAGGAEKPAKRKAVRKAEPDANAE